MKLKLNMAGFEHSAVLYSTVPERSLVRRSNVVLQFCSSVGHHQIVTSYLAFEIYHSFKALRVTKSIKQDDELGPKKIPNVKCSNR